MKICVISSMVFPVPPPGYSGLEQLAWQQAEGLARKGHEVTLIAPEGSRCDHAKLLMPGPPGGIDEKTAYGRYWQELLKFDVIIDSSWQKWAYILKQEGRLKAPVLGVMHAPVNTMLSSPPPVDRGCVVCISKDQASHYEALFSKPARVAYNGVDTKFYQAIHGVKRTNRFLFLARFSTIKGPDTAIKVCREAGVGLDLVGDTSITNEPALLEQCRVLCDGRQVRMVGPATRGECVRWFTQAHALIHPNERFREPFGLAPVESMGCGCPVIAWDYGAMRETIKHGETGFLANSYESLLAYIRAFNEKTEHGLAVMRENCRDWALQFSFENMINRYEELCNEAIAGGW